MRDLTPNEKEALQLTGDLANYMVRLPSLHFNDNQDVYFHIRAIQNIIHARPSVEHHFNGEFTEDIKVKQ